MLLFIFGLITLVYLFVYFAIPNIFEGSIGTYLIRPIIFVILGIIIYFISKNEGLNILKFKKIRRWEFGRNPFEAGLMIAALQISLLIIAGVIFGFGYSTLSHTPIFLIINTFFIFSTLISLELARSYLIKKGLIKYRNINIVIGLTTLFFFIIMIPPNKFIFLDYQNNVDVAMFFGEILIPTFALSLFASYLAYLGGAIASIGYIGLLQAFEWYSPILPDLDWGVKAIIVTLSPTIGYLIIQKSIQTTQKNPNINRIKSKKKDPMLSWVGVAALCVIIVFFSTGMLGFQTSVIYSGSMNPTLGVGDVVIITEIDISDIDIGDIIQYEKEDMNIPIIHRVQEIKEFEEGSKYFITKGDANNIPDPDPVYGSNIRGKIIFSIPKIGWISIYIQDLLK
jgi:signal peptidase